MANAPLLNPLDDRDCVGEKKKMNPKNNLVLVVDDDADTREIVTTVLESKGFRTLQASNGLEALEAVEGTERPDLILLDMSMPVMDGATFRRIQLQHGPVANIPVIVLTALEADQIPEMQAFGVFRKPFEPAELIEQVANGCLRSAVLPNKTSEGRLH